MDNVVKSLWISSEIDEMQIVCMNSFIELGHEFHLYTYGEIQNVPNGVIIKNANDIINEEFVFKDKFNSYATFSDWFRIKLLYDLGGWWVDCDVLCLKKFISDWPYIFATEISKSLSGEEYPQICNAIIKMPKESKVGLEILLAIGEKMKTINSKELFWTEIGAKIISEKILKFNLTDYVVSPEVFCPINYFNFKDLLKDSIAFSDDTYGVHLWNKMWEWNNENILSNPESKSFFSKYRK
ncbi:hypothetical protein JYB64_20565 [Algoriphagus aestuarii]|nr:hypothetical protein [Algoriphagus aestuarii]